MHNVIQPPLLPKSKYSFLGVDDEGDPADGDEEDAGTVDLVQEDLVLPSQLNLKPAGSVATFKL